jgi:hypothetical protein
MIADAHLPYTEQRLVEVSAAYRVAELEFDQACRSLRTYANSHFDTRFVVIPGQGILSRVNAMNADPERKRLERARDLALQKRNALLAERAALRKSLGL